jgi:NodT family efflux transporter outer membrane factor (OMF) lipoprotein
MQTTRSSFRSHAARPPGLKRTLAGSLCAIVLGGCADVSMKPYETPVAPAKTSWSGQPVSATETIAPDWWRGFKDPYLDGLVNKAAAGNFDVKILAARVQVANAQVGEARAGALPSLNAAAGSSFEKTTGQKFSKTYNVGTQVSWDIDIWGKVEKGVEAQRAAYQASEADWRAGYLTLASSVSTTYFQILQLDEQMAQQQKALDKAKQILGIYDAMQKNGLLPNTRVLQQRAEINRLTNEFLDLERSRNLAGNALATLLGMPAGDFKVPPGSLRDKVTLPAVPAGLPADLLKRRPDLVAAEYRVLQSYNLVGEAKLAQLPSINLTGRGGSSSFALTDLLKSFTFGLLPSVNIPILDPSVKARVKTSEAETRVAEEEYRKTVVTAFEEVENALVNLDAHKKQRVELQQQVDSLRTVGATIQAQLKEGVVSQLELFESERSLLQAELALLANHQQILSDTVTLYKVLGGGWPAVTVGNAAQ